MSDLPHISVSDRISFKRCRRQWDWGSRLRSGLSVRGETATPLWFGSGCHYALEDFHGYNKHGNPQTALEFYCDNTKRERPDDWRDHLTLGCKILDYYVNHWLRHRDTYKTVWVDGEPQVEVRFEIPFETPHGPALHTGVLDRIVTDEFGRLYVMDYKFMKKFDSSKLPLDPQMTTYAWAATQLYGKAFEGGIYMQFKKEAPEEPTRLRGGELSTSKANAIPASLYREAIIGDYGSLEGAPPKIVEYYNWLVMQETPDADALIRREIVRRNEAEIENEADRMLMEATDMLDPDIMIYPNPTRDCNWCPFQVPCMAKEAGFDWETLLSDGFAPRGETKSWRAEIEEGSTTTSLFST